MADPRFFEPLGPLPLSQIAALTSAAILHPDAASLHVTHVAPLNEAAAGVLVYAEKLDALRAAPDGALTSTFVLCPEEAAPRVAELGGVALVCKRPRASFALAADALYRKKSLHAGPPIHDTARIDPSAQVCALVTIGEGAQIGADAVIEPGAVIGPGVSIGARTRIGPNVTIYCASIGQDCNILAGAVIGESGFGIAVSERGAIEVPHLGGVRLGDHVTLGAHSTIDRSVFGDTLISNGCRFDNHCHVGHNCTIGENFMMAAFGGISGSVTIGKNVACGGRVGIADHLKIGDGAQLAAGCAIMRDIPAGETWGGIPGQPLRDWMKEVSAVRRLAKNRGKKS